jgi:predicted alpha/beta-hydrolase family hydrolase
MLRSSGTLAVVVGAAIAVLASNAADAAPGAFYPVAREPAAGLPDRTVYRPLGPKRVRHRLPVLIWSNGGCRPANPLYISTLMLLAARGFIVVADGAPEAPSDTATGPPHPERMTEVIDWLNVAPEARRQLGNKVDRSRVAVAGTSCGGAEAMVAGADPRVDSVLSLNSGFFPTPEPLSGYGRDSLTRLHTPVLFLNGGPADVAHQNSVENYELVRVPAALVENPQGGHAGLFYGMRLGLPDDGMVTILEETVEILVNWLDYTVNGNDSARSYFTGDCGLCDVPGWSVQTKNGL